MADDTDRPSYLGAFLTVVVFYGLALVLECLAR